MSPLLAAAVGAVNLLWGAVMAGAGAMAVLIAILRRAPAMHASSADEEESTEAGRVQVAVGHASDFMGPRVWASAMGGDLVIKRAIQGKAAQVVGDVDTPHSYTYMPDIGRALVTLAQHEDAFGQVWHLPTPPALSTQRMLELIYAEAGQPLKMQAAFKWLLRLLGLFNPDAGEMVEMVYEFEKPFLIDDRKFVRRFGWGATDLATAVQETVAWL